ncbi:hypothetical protein [Actinomadura roseirufa]|uniref:hypothetical protein n=1 Tax=Actinomadura roseirufa TaxID=2094049 RepID=UPI001041926F|nr:hypothetical protein [Actinomadura roseirufa]
MADEERGEEPAQEEEARDAAPEGGQGEDAGRPVADVGGRVVYNNFFSQVDQRGSTYGMGETWSGERVRAVTGRIGATVIEEAVAGYASPGACYETAYASLASDHVVVTTGKPGLGKRTGALVMLGDVLGPEGVIVALPPSISLRELARREYQAGYGYVVLDRVGGVGDSGTEVDHAWLSVVDRVCEAGAYLVVTVSDATARAFDSVRSVPWELPKVTSALRIRLGARAEEGDLKAVESRLPDGFTMRDLVQIGELLADGYSAEEAVADVLDEAGRQKVHEWFEKEPSEDQVVKATVLVFVPLIVERHYEMCFRLLMEFIEPEVNEQEDAEGDNEPRAMAQERRREDDLIRVVRVNDGAGTRRALAFREDAFRRYVLEELTARYGNVFWDAVRAWLDRLVVLGDDGARQDIASALALLAYFDRDETEAYLDYWSRDKIGWQGQATAVYILWYLCLDEAMVPVAQRIAEHWAGQGTGEQRYTAIRAFCGELGVRLPHLGARRLWQLVRQDNLYSEPAALAFGELFGTLVVRDGDAGQLIGHLRTQLEQYEPVGPSRNHYRLTLLTVLAVLRARSARSGDPAIVEYLRDRPERLSAVAELWATALRFRPFRRLALEALMNGLAALSRLSGTDAEREARALGDALGAALPPEEHDLLRTDFLALLTHARSGAARAQNLGEILLAALDRAADILNRRS